MYKRTLCYRSLEWNHIPDYAWEKNRDAQNYQSDFYTDWSNGVPVPLFDVKAVSSARPQQRTHRGILLSTYRASASIRDVVVSVSFCCTVAGVSARASPGLGLSVSRFGLVSRRHQASDNARHHLRRAPRYAAKQRLADTTARRCLPRGNFVFRTPRTHENLYIIPDFLLGIFGPDKTLDNLSGNGASGFVP